MQIVYVTVPQYDTSCRLGVTLTHKTQFCLDCRSGFLVWKCTILGKLL